MLNVVPPPRKIQHSIKSLAPDLLRRNRTSLLWFRIHHVKPSSLRYRRRTQPAPERPQDQNYCYEQNNHPNPKKNQNAVLVHQQVHAALSVETIESADDPGQGQQVLLAQLKGAFVRMISRTQKGFPGLVQFDMPAKRICDWTLLDKFSDTPRAREVRVGILNQKSPW